MIQAIVTELERIVGAENLCIDANEVRRRTGNTLGLEREILGIVYPQTTDEVQAIVRLANLHHFPLYPYSTARNIGYGERLPVAENNLIVDLGRMNQIIHVDTEEGYADVQPGVTQGQLCDHLRENRVPFFMDATGCGRDSSIVGNSLEGGFGTTPRGNKRKEISCVEGVLGNGERFRTGSFPGGLGPDLAGVFVQSNFGIITRLRMPLNPVVEDCRSFTIRLSDESDLVELVAALRELRQRGSLTNQVIIMNALDALCTSGAEIPEAYVGKTITNADALEILSGPLVPFGAISAIGCVYGSKAEVRAKARTVRRALRRRLGRRVKIQFMGGRTISLLTKVLSAWPLSKLEVTANLAEALESYAAVHGLMLGVANDVAMVGLLGGVRDTYEHKRLMWYSSRISSLSQDVAKFVEITAACYRSHRFEAPLEMLLVTANDIIAIQKVEWTLADEEEELRAWQLYEALSQTLREAGFLPYRLGVQSQAKVSYDEEQQRLLRSLKQAFDPNDVIAPGRYGIDVAMH
jgi:4-cresol dehydrogenase (hydroxylating)